MHLLVALLPFLLCSSLTAFDFWAIPSPCDPVFDATVGCWLETDFLYWKINDTPSTPPLVTEGPAVPNLAPTLGQPGTEVVLGGKKIPNKMRAGGKITAGYWFDVDEIFGAEFVYLFLNKGSHTEKVSSSGFDDSPFLAITFFDALTGAEASTALARPGSFSGTGVLKLSNKMDGIELNFLGKLNVCSPWDLTLMVGFRHWYFTEHLNFTTSSPDVFPPVDTFRTKDRFHTNNTFWGGQIGLFAEYTWNCFFFRAKAKLALGSIRQKLHIQGTLLTDNFGTLGDPSLFLAGYFALPTNHGTHREYRFTALPEINLNVGYWITCNLGIQLGYTFLAIGNVMRASNQIDRDINPTQAPAISGNPSTKVVGIVRPKALFNTSSFWAQGLNVGFVFRF